MRRTDNFASLNRELFQIQRKLHGEQGGNNWYHALSTIIDAVSQIPMLL
jgi:hypothetical protein